MSASRSGPATTRTGGALIVLEGPEGVGKTTQAALLRDALADAGHAVVAVREPGGTPLGDAIRAQLLDPASDIVPRAEALLFMASRAQLVEQVIRPALERGAVVVADRFFLSTFAYQGAGRGVSDEELIAANRVATGGLTPGLTLLLRLPAEEGLARAALRSAGAIDRMESLDRDFHARVRAAFDEQTGDAWQRAHPDSGPVRVVDATGSTAEVLDRLLDAVAERWPELGVRVAARAGGGER